MKKISLIIALITVSIQLTTAQNSMLSSAESSLEGNDLRQAKFYIDKAAKHSETENSPRMYYLRGVILTFIAASDNAEINKLDLDAAYNACESLVKFFDFSEAERKKYNEDAVGSIANAVIVCFNEALNKTQIPNNFNQVEKYTDICLKLIDIDNKNKKDLFGKISAEKTYKLCREAAFKDSLTDKELYYIDKLIAKDYNDVFYYLRAAEIYTERKDYDKAISYLDKGKKRFPEKASEFLKYEINIEISRDNVPQLLNKFNQSIASDPNNSSYYLYRGIVYQRIIDNENKNHSNRTVYFAQALNDYRKAVELDDYCTDCKANEASILLDSANWVYNKMLDEHDPAEAAKLKGIADNAYRLVIDKFELIRQGGSKTGSELLEILNVLRKISKRVGEVAKAGEYNKMYNEQKERLSKE